MRGGGQNSDANDTAILWAPIVVVVLSLILWFFFHTQIARFLFFIKTHELGMMIQMLTPLAKVLAVFHLPGPNIHKMITVQYAIAGSADSHTTIATLMDLSHYVGTYLRVPVDILLAVMAAVLFFCPAAQRYRTTYSMSTLRDSESCIRPQITPILPLNLVKTDIEKGPWSMAKKPLDFCFEKGLIDRQALDTKGELVVSQGAAYKALAMQLGSPWRGVRNLPVHTRAFFVIFAAYASHERDLAEKLLDQIAASATKGGCLDFSGIDDLIPKYESAPFVQWLVKNHAYVNTLMMSLLMLARTSGVVASAQFLWLKPVDRRLWFTLNSVGRQTAVAEVCGIYAHWLAEKKIGRALKTPMVKQAITGLSSALSDIQFSTEDDLWRDSVA